MRGRKLFLKSLKAGAYTQGEGFGQRESYLGLKVLAGAVDPRSAIGGGSRKVAEGVAVPLLVITFKLEPQANPIGAELGVLVTSHYTGVSLGEFITVAHQTHRESVVVDGGRAFHGASPS